MSLTSIHVGAGIDSTGRMLAAESMFSSRFGNAQPKSEHMNMAAWTVLWHAGQVLNGATPPFGSGTLTLT
jgi:hypothetical protein